MDNVPLGSLPQKPGIPLADFIDMLMRHPQVQQQLFHCPNFEPCQERCAFRTNAT